MTKKPKCIIVTGQPGSGKTTLSKLLGERLWMPVISRDEIKEGYVNTYGVRHDRLPGDTNAIVSNFFLQVVLSYLSNNVSIIIEAAFQNKVWKPMVDRISEVGSPFIIICSLDSEAAGRRHLERGLKEPKREYYHSDKRVSLFRATGVIGPPEPYDPPSFDMPTIHVSTDGAYSPSLEEIVGRFHLNDHQPFTGGAAVP
jgi:predicted kinase